MSRETDPDLDRCLGADLTELAERHILVSVVTESPVIE